MPMKPKRPCRFPGCSGFCEQGQVYCKNHIGLSSERLRGGAASRGYDRKWRDARAAFLRRNPICIQCFTKGKLEPATVVDHIVPHRGDPKLFWDQRNWQPLCKGCHDRKTGAGL